MAHVGDFLRGNEHLAAQLDGVVERCLKVVDLCVDRHIVVWFVSKTVEMPANARRVGATIAAGP